MGHPEVDEHSEMIGWVPVRGNGNQRPAHNTQLSVSGLPQLIIMFAGVVALSCFGSYFFVNNRNTQNQLETAKQEAVTAEKKDFINV